MKLLLQPDAPTDWQASDSREWTPGAPIHAVDVQGVVFSGYESIAVETLAGGRCRVTVWKARDVPEGERVAQVWDFWPLAPDPLFGGAYNVTQEHRVYGEPVVLARFADAAVSRQPWEAFTPPAHLARPFVPYQEPLMRHLSERGWREWTEGVPADMLDARGHVRDQRALGRYNKPRGTLTWYQSNTALANGIHVADHEMQLVDATGSSATLATNNFGGGASRLTHCWTTASGVPGVAQWPTGTYRCQLDCTAAGAGMSYGLRTAGSVDGHFARVNSGLTSDLETKAQTEALFTGTGLKLATTGSVSWSSGATSDRFEVLVAGTRAASGGNQTYTLRVNLSDDFADGPWTAAGNAAHYLAMMRTA